MKRVSRIPLPPRLPFDAHKGLAGRVLAFAGSADMPGAALLCAQAAQRAGAGLVRMVCEADEVRRALAVGAPEAVQVDARGWPKPSLRARLERLWPEGEHHAALIGPGLGQSARARKLLEAVLAARVAPVLVLDADALNLLAGQLGRIERCASACVLTPHHGEAQRLLGRTLPTTPAGRRSAALELARESSAVVLLKGAPTLIADPLGSCFENPGGNPGMATAGSGDVLAGILVAYLAGRASGLDPSWTALAATRAAARAHALAGDLARRQRGVRGLIARDLIEFLPAAQRALDPRELS